MTGGEGATVLLGDAHLFDDDPEVDAFVRFTETLPTDVRTLVILGDLFATWIGRPELTRPHHARVLQALRRLKSRGCRILYVEGNHDFFLGPLYAGDPFDLIVRTSLDLPLGDRPVHLAHGDLMNRRDRQYRAWRALSKNRLFFGLFNLLPAASRQRIVGDLERRMAGTNLAFRGGFPYAECEIYARRQISRGAEILVFGHFHEELTLTWEEGGRRGTVFVLPAWRAGHRHLRLAPDEEPAFVSS